MDDAGRQPLEQALRTRLSRFLSATSRATKNSEVLQEVFDLDVPLVYRRAPRSWRGLKVVLDIFDKYGWPAVIFGGLIRDLMVTGAARQFRDVDIVVDEVSVNNIECAFAPYIRRRTRFGGLHLRVSGWMFDVWPLRETWAFRERFAAPDFHNLPKTTFLNVEAVAVDLHSVRGRPRKIFENGFFDGMSNRIVEINLEENLYPALCIVRSLVTAYRLGFSCGPRLVDYILKESKGVTADEFARVQMSHYGRIILPPDEVWSRIQEMGKKKAENGTDPIALSVTLDHQLALWNDGAASR